LNLKTAFLVGSLKEFLNRGFRVKRFLATKRRKESQKPTKNNERACGTPILPLSRFMLQVLSSRESLAV
jgi:hypothetical protein